MTRWTSGYWFKPITIMLLTAFFTLYGVNIGTYVGIAKAHAQSLDDLLDEDDSDLLGEPVKEEPPAKEVEEPASEPQDEMDEQEEDKAEDAQEEDEAVEEDEEEAEDQEEETIAEDEEEEEVAPAPSPRRKADMRVFSRPRVDGPNKIAAVVFPSNSRYTRRAVEEDVLIRSWLRGHESFSYTSVNKALGDSTTINEDSQAQEAQAALSDGVSAYNSVDLTTAVEDLEDATSLYGPLLIYPEYQQKLEEAMMYLAASHILNGDEDEGQKVFTKLLKSNPDFTLDGKGMPPGVKDTFEDTKDELADAPRAALSISSQPSKMPVYLDGHFRGLSPIQLDNLSIGEHYLEISYPAYQTYSSKLTLYKGVSKSISAKLKQTRKYYSYRAEMETIERNFEHKYMWEAVKNLGRVLGQDQLLLVKVGESDGIVTLEGFYYDLPQEQYKVQTLRVDLASEGFDEGTYEFLDRLFGNDTEWQDTYIPPAVIEKKKDDAAAGPFYTTWWFWTIVGVVVAGGVTTGVLLGTGVLDDSGSDSTSPGDEFDNPNAITVRF